MLPEPNAPTAAQPWVRNVTNRSEAILGKATRTEHNAYALAATAKSAYELLGNRIVNIDTFTTGLFEQGSYSNELSSYAELSSLAPLYTYASGDYQEHAVIVRKIPFARYNALTVTASGHVNAFATSSTATDINSVRPLRPMITAQIPPLPIMRSNGSYEPNGLTYAERWTVENFEPFLDYNIPGNVIPDSFSTEYSQGPPGMHPGNGTNQVRESRDGYVGYSMRYTREWLLDYMRAIADYATENSPLEAGSYYLPPDVNQVNIFLGYFYRTWESSTANNNLQINDNRLTFDAGSTFILEGIRNLGY